MSPETPTLTWRPATRRDSAVLAELNHQLVADEGHRNPMSVQELERRMRSWLEEGYDAVLFEAAGGVVAYALYRAQPDEIYLRHFFVVRHRRRLGIGRAAIGLLRCRIWPPAKRLTVSVLCHNDPGIQFWRAMGYHDYCLTLEIVP
jgi:predicted acetyltransferase